jgi:hypothetical protein
MPSRLQTLTLLGSLLLSGCAAVQPTPQSLTEKPWREVSTEHLTLLTNLDEKTARKSAVDLERHRRALLMMWGPQANPAGKLEVIVLRTEQDLQTFAGTTYAGFYVGSTDTLVLAGETAGFVESTANVVVQVHELAHSVMRTMLRRQPRWLAEGLASYLETTHINASDEVVLGKVSYDRLMLVRARGRIPFEGLRAWRDDSAFRESDVSMHQRLGRRALPGERAPAAVRRVLAEARRGRRAALGVRRGVHRTLPRGD